MLSAGDQADDDAGASKISRTIIAAFTISMVTDRGELLRDPRSEFDARDTNATDTAVAELLELRFTINR